jgi:hypothetical protein
VINPLSISRRISNKNNGASFAFHLGCDPSLNRSVSAAGDRFPIIIGCGLVPLDDADISHLARPSIVQLVMEAIETFASH